MPAADEATLRRFYDNNRRRFMSAPLWEADHILLAYRGFTMSQDRRQKRDLHALNEDGMVLCNPRDREAAHRAEMEGIATEDHAAVTCRKCLDLLYKLTREKREE